MGNNIGSASRWGHLRDRAIRELLPDVCTIFTYVRTVTPSGSYEETPGEPLTYRGSVNIPCRLDVAKFFRGESVFGQEAVVTDYELHLPYDAPIYPDYTVMLNGLRYEVRLLFDNASNTVTKTALVTLVDVAGRIN